MCAKFIFAVGLSKTENIGAAYWTNVHCTVLYSVQSVARRNICTIWYREAHFSLPCQKARVLQLNHVFNSADVSRTANVKKDVTSPRLIEKKLHCHVTDTCTIAINMSLHWVSLRRRLWTLF